jgi:hypothetical protein
LVNFLETWKTRFSKTIDCKSANESLLKRQHEDNLQERELDLGPACEALVVIYKACANAGCGARASGPIANSDLSRRVQC